MSSGASACPGRTCPGGFSSEAQPAAVEPGQDVAGAECSPADENALSADRLGPAPSPNSEAVYQAYLNFQDLVRGGHVTASWILGGPSFWYAEGGPQDRVMWRVDPETNAKEPLFDVPRLRAALSDALGDEPAGRGVPFVHLDFVGEREVEFALEGREWTIQLDSYTVTRRPVVSSAPAGPVLVSEAARATPGTFYKDTFGAALGEVLVPERPSPDGRWFASVRDHNIALRSTADGHYVMLTDDGAADVPWDVETVLWEAWSPESQRLAVFKVDAARMMRLPTIHWLKPLESAEERLEEVPAGGVINRNELYILDVNHGPPVRVELGDTTDQYLLVLGWLPDGSEVVVARYDRLFGQVELLAIDPVTGVGRRVLVEATDTWLSSVFVLWNGDVGFWMLPDGSGFIWRSERDGWSHLYRYDMGGELLAQLTTGQFPVNEVVQIDQDEGWVYFQAHGDLDRIYDNHLYRVALDGGEVQQLTRGNGRHSITMAPSCEVFLDTFSSVDVPPQTVLRKADGDLLQILAEADVSRLEQVGWVPSKEYVVKAADGETDMWVTIHFPYNFEPGRKYPVFEEIYAGPQVMKRAMDFGLASPAPFRDATFDDGPVPEVTNYPRALAQHGFLVLTMDGRGTPGRSKAFRDVRYANWGSFEIADHAGAIKQLAAMLPFIDVDRVAVSGASWGGHYAFRALVQAPEVYKWGIPEVPEYDSRAHTFYEAFLGGTPAENKAVYDAADVLALAPQLKGKLLQTTGANDSGTQRQLFQMSEALIRRGIHHENMIYPNAGHRYFGATARYNNALKTQWLIAQMRQ